MNCVSNSKVLIYLFFWLSSFPILYGLSRNESISSAVEEIRNGEFLLAQRTILSIDNKDDVIPDIVQTLYNSSQNNADVILDFSKATTKIYISLLLLTELHNEMKKYRHRDPYKLMALVRAMTSEVLNQSKTNNSEKAQKVIDEVTVENEKSVKEIFKSFMITNNFQNNKVVQTLTGTLFEFNEKSSELVMNELIDEQILNTSAVRIANDIMYGYSKTSQIASGLTFLFSKLLHNNNMDNPAILRIANYISKLKSWKSYVNTSKKIKYAVNLLIEKLPMCAKNLNFADEVCIKNRGKAEYIFASESEFYHNTSKRRAVFTSDVDQITDNGAWRVVQLDHDIYFKNQAHTKEYLYASPFEMYDSEKRHIQTWSDDGTSSRSIYSAWSVELKGDYCQIKNNHFQEYLYASNLIYSDKNRYVFTAKNGMFHKLEPEFQWQIEDCS